MTPKSVTPQHARHLRGRAVSVRAPPGPDHRSRLQHRGCRRAFGGNHPDAHSASDPSSSRQARGCAGIHLPHHIADHLELSREGSGRRTGGRKRARESDKDCLRREIKEELPKFKLGRLRLWKDVRTRNRRSGRKMSDAIFVAAKASGRLTIGDKKEIDRAIWRRPRGIRLTPTSRYIRDKLFPKSN